MKQSIKSLTALAIVAMLFVPSILNAQKMRKKYKNAPDQTVVVVANPLVEAFEASHFPHLQFYYLGDKLPHFLSELNDVQSLPPPNGVTGMVIDKQGTIAYVRGFSNELAKNIDRDSYEWTMLSVARKSEKPLDNFLKAHVAKGKNAKTDGKKVYTPGETPIFKGWNKGKIEGMALPNFDLVAQNGSETSIHNVLDGKPAFIIFTKISTDGKTYTPLFWHIEHVFYNYYPPRNR